MLRLLRAELGGGPALEWLFQELLGVDGYSRSFVDELLGVARGTMGHGWEVRCLATLLLQDQLLKIPSDREEEFDAVLAELGVKPAGLEAPPDEAVLHEGYSTTDPAGFRRELRRRLQRMQRILRPLRGRRTSPWAWRQLVSYARQECKLDLARYLFTADEVAARIRDRVRISRGLGEPLPSGAEAEARRARERMPELEAGLLDRLAGDGEIYWVSGAVSSRLNSLVEHPLGTVVLAVKPPGSDRELEVKRAGRNGDRPLGVVYRRRGTEVPVSHRLDGGSMARQLQWDARSSSLLARIYRRVHAEDAPLSTTLAVSSIQGVPARDGEAHILDYLTRAEVFGKGFSAMRRAMRRSVEAFGGAPDGPGDGVWLTGQFLRHVAPGQSILVNTSSFRLDRVARYLSAGGAQVFFRELRLRAGRWEGRRLADEVLEEILGEYAPPSVPYRSHESYVAAAFAVPQNRMRARRAYRRAVRRIGRLWGTLLAAGGWSNGESFVARNVGLKSIWARGRWEVGILFMDHDDLQVEPHGAHPLDVLHGMYLDGQFVREDLDLLARIYRIPDDAARLGRSAFRDELRRAHRRTLAALGGIARRGEDFSAADVRWLRRWSSLLGSVAASHRESPGTGAWREGAKAVLAAAGFDAGTVEGSLDSLADYAEFLADPCFLF